MGPMTPLRGRPGTAVAATVLLAAGLSGCGLLEGSSRIEEALEYLPGEVTGVTFVDRATMAERLERDESPATDEGYATELSAHAKVMEETAAFDDSDLEWEVVGTTDGGLVRVWKLSDDLDLAAVAADLEDAGYERSGSEDTPRLRAEITDVGADGLVGGRYPAFLLDVAIVPDEHLLVSGTATDLVLDAVADETDSLSDTGTFDDLLDHAPDEGALEYAALTVRPTCPGGETRGTALLAASEEPVAAVRLFDSEEEAADDARNLPGLLDEQAATGWDVDLTVEQDGDAVVAEADFAQRRPLVTSWRRAQGPFGCPSSWPDYR